VSQLVEPAVIGDARLARIVTDPDGTKRTQTLAAHLNAVAAQAGEFGAAFGTPDWAALAGLLHDVGKCHPVFQGYLRAATGYEPDAGNPHTKFDHAIGGASLAMERFPGEIGKVVAYVVAGHHAGLADWGAESGPGALSVRLHANQARLDEIRRFGGLEPKVLEAPIPTSRPPVPREDGLHVWIRMLLSCVVDADSLDAEAFADPGRREQRAAWPSLATLERRLDVALAELPTSGAVNELRSEIRDQVMRHATDAPGFFSLTVPTGGGKTLTSLAFALSHARAHAKRRVIYAIPYLSIIEQTADVFRKVVGDGVLEHHSSIDVDDTDWRSALAAENWDAPLVVTTTVQLYESLFASKRSQCRKLHNIASSVIVLDEAQSIPPDFLAPILSMLRVLVEGFGVTVVLCTATQPALGDHLRPDGTRFRGLAGVRELVDNPDDLGRRLERVTIAWPANLTARAAWTEIAEALNAAPQVLCVVNTRADARSLAVLLPDSLHLSALMCAEHRSAVVDRARSRLGDGEPVCLVSTQLIEAGVDIDFPVVFRALAGIDSVAQAAGRCNREGKQERGRVVVFVPPRSSPAGHLRQSEQATGSILAGEGAPALSPDLYRHYFQLLYGVKDSLDAKGILPLLVSEARSVQFRFREAGEKFRLIDDEGTVTAFVPFGRGSDLIDELRRRIHRGAEPDRYLLRRLQRFTVSLRQHERRELEREHGLEDLGSGLVAVAPSFYDTRLGVVLAGRDFSTSLVV
jgi:CRISPR-associated endonuclease/helicase Cas3